MANILLVHVGSLRKLRLPAATDEDRRGSKMRSSVIFLWLIILSSVLVMHLKLVYPTAEITQPFPLYHVEPDLFTYWRSRFVIVLAFFGWGFTRYMNWRVGLFLALLFLSTLFSDSPYTAIYGLPNYNEGALCWFAYIVCLMLGFEVPESTFASIIRTALLVVSAGCILQTFTNPFELPGIHQLITQYPIQMEVSGKLCATMMNPNHLGLFAALLAPFFLARQEWLTGLLAMYLSMGSGSRGSALAVTVACSFLVMRGSRRRQQWLIACCVSALTIYAIARYQFDLTGGGRTEIWTSGFPAMLKAGFLGYGPANFPMHIPQGVPGSKFAGMLIDRPHNFYIQVWVGTGLLSLISLLSIFAQAFERGALRYRAAILGFLVAACFTDSFIGVSPLFFALVGNAMRKEEK